MSTQVGIGFSQHKDSMVAAQEAAQQGKDQLKKERIDFAILLNSVNYAPEEILPVVCTILDNTRLIGSSTAGIILSDRIETHGVAVLAFHSDNIVFETSFTSHLDLQNMNEAGQTFGQSSITDWGQKNRKVFLFFVDGLMKDLSGLTEGIKGKLGQFFPIIGAGSTDDFHFQRTYQYQQNQYLSHSAVGVLLGGKPVLALSGTHGWKPLGKPRTINESQGNVIKTIDRKSAFTLYRDYFEQHAETLRLNRLGQINVRYPLGVLEKNQKQYILRNVVEVLDDESIVCQDNVHKDSTVNMMIGNKETCLQSAEQAAQALKEQLDAKKPSVVIVLESILRYKLLGRTALKEIKLIQNIVGPDIPVFGMYSHGEIFPVKSSDNHLGTIVNNGSIVLLAIG